LGEAVRSEVKGGVADEESALRRGSEVVVAGEQDDPFLLVRAQQPSEDWKVR
jgi:hypothetical protein